MSILIKIKDKTGRTIHLTRERWSHIQKHPEMSHQLEQISETLIQPDTIKKVEYDKDVRFYYRYFKFMRKYLLVSVKYLNGKGFIITSFYTDKIK